MTPERRRQQDRAYQLRKRRRKLAAMQGSVCVMKRGKHWVCGGTVREVVDRLGRVEPVCDRCERRMAGVCRDCPRKVSGRVGHAVYCTPCRTRVGLAHNRKWVANNRSRKNATVRGWKAKHPEYVKAYEKERYWAGRKQNGRVRFQLDHGIKRSK